MNRLALTFLAVAVLGATAFAQGRLSKDGDPGNPDRPERPTAAVRGPNVNASLPSKPMRLITSGATIEDFVVGPDDINADEKHRTFSSLSLSIPADSSRTYVFVCAAAAGFWQQVPSTSPLMVSPVLLVRFDTPLVDGGSFYRVLDIPERRREFTASVAKGNHTPLPSGCGIVDEPSMVLVFSANFGMSDSDALAAARAVIRSPMKLTVGLNVRMTSVSTFGLQDPVLQVWSD